MEYGHKEINNLNKKINPTKKVGFFIALKYLYPMKPSYKHTKKGWR
jgi:beta-glucosidase/6-phospho-beta-glucosidase/beta-galactosidase